MEELARSEGGGGGNDDMQIKPGEKEMAAVTAQI